MKKEFEVDEFNFPRITHAHYIYLKDKAQLTNYPVGSDVICKANDDKSYSRGKITNYMGGCVDSKLLPLVTFEDGTSGQCMGIIRHYSKELCDVLDKLDGLDQWNVLSEFYKVTRK